MSEAELRESLRAAVADEPPLHFDPDALIARAQTFRRRRRALVAVGVATFALIGTVLALPGVLAPPREAVDAARVLTTTAQPPAPVSPFAATGVPPSTSPAALPAPEDVKRLSGYLAKQVAVLAPGVADVKVDFTGTGQPTPGHLTGYAYLVDKRGTTTLSVEVIGPPVQVTRAGFCAPAACEPPRVRDDGSRVEVASSTAPERDLFTHTVAHFRTDGTVVIVTSHPYDGAQPYDRGQVTSTPPLTVEQLITLATDPVLTLAG